MARARRVMPARLPGGSDMPVWHGLRMVSPDLAGSRVAGKGGRGVEDWSPLVASRRIALVTVLAFGCATVRVPVTGHEEPADGFGTVAPPITELWLESSGEVAPEVARE